MAVISKGQTRRPRVRRSTAFLAVCLTAVLLLDPRWTRPAAAEQALDFFATAPGLPGSVSEILVPFVGTYIGEILFLTAVILLAAHGDPSLCYRAEVHNPLTEAEDEFGNPTGDVFLDFDLPIAPLGANSVSATLTIELVDANHDGVAYMTHRAGFSEFQRAFLVEGPSGTSLGVHLATADLTAPGTYEFDAGLTMPIAGPTTAEAAKTSLITTFILSPGDTVLIRGKVVQDDGSGTPACEIPGPTFVTGCSDPGAILGSRDDDELDGTPGDDIICGGEGNDRIDGKGGNDRIFGGLGRDVIAGGAGRDLIHGEDGNDIICGDAFAGPPRRNVGTDSEACVSGGAGSANDTIFGDAGNDSLGGGPGADEIHGGAGRDKIAGGPGRDRLFGDDGKDRLAGGSEKDTIRGGTGADRLIGDEGDDKLLADDGAADESVDGGEGQDSARIDAGLDTSVTSVETFLP